MVLEKLFVKTENNNENLVHIHNKHSLPEKEKIAIEKSIRSRQ